MKDNFLIQDDMKIMKKKANGVGYGSLGIYGHKTLLVNKSKNY